MNPNNHLIPTVETQWLVSNPDVPNINKKIQNVDAQCFAPNLSINANVSNSYNTLMGFNTNQIFGMPIKEAQSIAPVHGGFDG